MWRELFLVACLVPVIMTRGQERSICYHEENGIISSKLGAVCAFEYNEQLSKHVRRTAVRDDKEIRLRPGESEVCWPVDAHRTACQCRGNYCNDMMYCHIGDKFGRCHDSCSARFEPYPDRPGYNITRECGPWTKIRLESEPHDAECTRFPNGSATCICDREQCNNETYMQCYGYSNERTAALLETCPLKTTGCFVARDPKTQKLIEAGCDVSDHGSGSQLVEKCSSDGCNYPMYCYDSSKDAIVQCEIGDVGCYVEFGEF
uniref:Uncharacterized protein n=1 Tax=Panagrolaimus sp. JU765 TaxID=591449 RepID=A0AC34PV16_9BILA